MAERYDAIVIGAGQAGPAQRGRWRPRAAGRARFPQRRRPREDDDVAAEIRAIREREGVAIRTGAQCMALSNVNGKISVRLECKGGEPVAQGSHVLLAVGRLPNTHDLGLNGDEIVHSLLDVMYAKNPYTTIQRAVHLHPTVTELIPTLLGNLKALSA